MKTLEWNEMETVLGGGLRQLRYAPPHDGGGGGGDIEMVLCGLAGAAFIFSVSAVVVSGPVGIAGVLSSAVGMANNC